MAERFQNLRRLRTFIKKELQFKEHVPLLKRMALLRRGFFSEAHEIYDFKSYGYQAFLTDWQRLQTRKINGAFGLFLDDKILFEKVFGHHFSVPKNVCLMDRGGFYPLESDHSVKSLSALLDYISDINGLVLKPLRGGGGHGIIFLKHEDKTFIVNGEKKDPRPLLEKILREKTPYLATDFIVQGSFASSLYSGTVNTLRIVTMLDPDNGKAFIPSTVQRIGTKASEPTDNCELGGLSVHVDPETGELGEGVVHPRGKGLMWMQHHPDTKERFTGRKIPNWDKMVEKIFRTAEAHPYLPYVGWDIVLGKQGFSVIEGNSYTGVDLLQVHKPFLTDPRIRRFYEAYGIVEKRD
jgi:hypothetical protein